MTMIPSVAHLSDEQLLAEVRMRARTERAATAALVASLAELDARRLYLRESCSSLFTYCTQVLHLSEHAAYGRIEAARAARRFPMILDRLADGSLTLTAVCLLAPHLTPANSEAMLAAAGHRSKREVEVLVATLRPQPSVASTVRKVPVPRSTQAEPARHDETRVDSSPGAADGGNDHVERPVSAAPSPNRPAVIAPLAPERYKLQFTVSGATYEKLRRAQDLMRHAVPNGDPAVIFDRALTVLVAALEKTKCAATTRPRAPRRPTSDSRYIPASVKRDVWKRDGGRCAFVGTNGRCTERGLLEFHHVVPYADGGKAISTNLELRCRAHNLYEAERWSGSLITRESRSIYSAPIGRSGTTL
jgi:hypothetical protein